MGKESSKKEFQLYFKEHFYLTEFQVTWCISTKQKNGNLSNLNIAVYESVFDYLSVFNSIWVDKDLGRKIVYVSASYKNTKNFQCFIQLFTTGISTSLCGIFKVTSIYTGLKCNRLERCWKTLTMNFQKSRVPPIDLKILHEIYTSLKQTYPDNSNRRNYSLAACPLFFVSSDNLNYNISIKLRPYGSSLGIDTSSLDNSLKNFKILRMHAVLHDAAGIMYKFYQEGPTYCHMLPWNCNISLLGHLS